MKTVFSSHGCTMSFAQLREVEVDERDNYPNEELDAWKEKYNLDEDSPVIWVTPSKGMAISYGADLEDKDKILLMNDNELNIYISKNDLPEPYEYSTKDKIIIPESNDGDNGFVMVC